MNINLVKESDREWAEAERRVKEIWSLFKKNKIKTFSMTSAFARRGFKGHSATHTLSLSLTDTPIHSPLPLLLLPFAPTEISQTIFFFFFTSGLYSSSSPPDSATPPFSSFPDRPRKFWGKKWRLWLSFRARRIRIWMKARLRIENEERDQMGFSFVTSFPYWVNRN